MAFPLFSLACLALSNQISTIVWAANPALTFIFSSSVMTRSVRVMSNEPGCSFQIRLPSVYTRPPCSIPQPRDICLAHRPPKWLRHGAADLLRLRRDDPRRKDVMSEPLTVRRELPAEQVL